jgi:hypothetical protein
VNSVLWHEVEGDAARFAVGQPSEVGIFIRPCGGPLDLQGLLSRINRVHLQLVNKGFFNLLDRRSRPERVGHGWTVVLHGYLDVPAMVMMDTVTMLEREGLAMNIKDFEISVLLKEDNAVIDVSTTPPKFFRKNKYSGSLRKLYEIWFATFSLDENVNFCSHGISPLGAITRARGGFTMYCSSDPFFG